MGCKKNCGNSLTTSVGTYTFHNSEMTKDDAAKFCEDRGKILAPITSQEEFNKIHKYVQGCCNLGGFTSYNIGLYVIGKNTKLFSNCEKWDSAKHEHLFTWNMENGPCYEAYYAPMDGKMTVSQDPRCGRTDGRPICFEAANAQALVKSESSNAFASVSTLSVMMAVAALVVSLAVALFISVRKLKHLKQSLPVSTN